MSNLATYSQSVSPMKPPPPSSSPAKPVSGPTSGPFTPRINVDSPDSWGLSTQGSYDDAYHSLKDFFKNVSSSMGNYQAYGPSKVYNAADMSLPFDDSIYKRYYKSFLGVGDSADNNDFLNRYNIQASRTSASSEAQSLFNSAPNIYSTTYSNYNPYQRQSFTPMPAYVSSATGPSASFSQYNPYARIRGE